MSVCVQICGQQPRALVSHAHSLEWMEQTLSYRPIASTSCVGRKETILYTYSLKKMMKSLSSFDISYGASKILNRYHFLQLYWNSMFSFLLENNTNGNDISYKIL